MAVGKSSIKRAMDSSAANSAGTANTESKDAAGKGTASKSATPVKKSEAKAVLKAAVNKSKQEKNVAAKSVIAATDEQVLKTVSQSEGINAHYGINTPLPTFLL